MKIIFFILSIIMFMMTYELLNIKVRVLKSHEKVVLATIATVFNIIIFATFLAVIGYYTLANVNIITLFINIVLLVLVKKNKSLIQAEKSGILFPSFLLNIVLIAALLYMLFPTTYMMMGRDPGLYLLNGIHIAESGSIQYKSDNYLNEHYDKIDKLIELGYPGLYSDYKEEIKGSNPGDIVPQFMPVFMVASAIGYNLFGIEGLIRVNALIGILCIMIIFIFAQRCFNTATAKLAVVLMLLNPAQLWAVRTTESEILAQLFFFTAVYLGTLGLENYNKWITGMAGLLLGFSVMVRMDSYILGVGVILYFAYVILWDSERVKLAGGMVGGYLLAGGISFLYGCIYSKPYFVSHMENGTLSLIISINILCLAIVGVCWVIHRAFRQINQCNLFERLISSKKAYVFFCLIILMIIVMLYFIRPVFNNSFSGRAMIEFSWYTSFTLVVFSVYGLFKLLYTDKMSKEILRKKDIYLLFLFIGIACMGAYILRPSITPDHIWASRRWITVNIPFIIILGCFGISHIKTNVIKYSVGAFLIAFMIYQTKPFLFTKIMEGSEIQYQQLASCLEEDKLYITNNEEIASAMKYIYNKNVYMMNGIIDNSIFTDYLDDNHVIGFIGDPRSLEIYGMELELNRMENIMTEGRFLEKTIGSFPHMLYDRERDASVYDIVINASDSRNLLDEMSVVDAEYKNNEIVGSKGILFYGPYINLEEGRYSIKLTVFSEKELDLMLEIVSGENCIEKYFITEQGTLEYFFSLEQATENLEFRLINNIPSTIRCSELILNK